MTFLKPLYHLQRHHLFTFSFVRHPHFYAVPILNSSKALMPPRCQMLWWGYSTGRCCRKAQHTCATLSRVLCHCCLTSSTVSQSFILAVFPSFFSDFLQHVIGTKLSWGRTQQDKPNTMFSLLRLGISDFGYSSLPYTDYSIWGLYLVWNSTSPPAKYLRKGGGGM